jgi:uncharacterized membrane protein
MSRPDRITYIDVLRGVAIVLMVVNHTSRWWIDVSMGWARYWLVYGSMLLPASLFLFLVGFALPLPFRGRPLPPLAATWPRYWRRGLGIVLAGMLLNAIVFRDEPFYAGGVLQTIGLSVILTAPAVWITRRRGGRAGLLALAAALYAAFVYAVPALRAWVEQHPRIALSLVYDFPLWPWIAASIVGVVAGTAWLDARAGGPEAERRFFAVLAGAGVLGLLLYAAWETLWPTAPRFGFPRDFVVNRHWTPRGVTLLLIGGSTAILTSVTYWLCEVRRVSLRALVVLGQTSMMLYVLHQVLAHTLVKEAMGHTFDSWWEYWTANVILMLALLGISYVWLMVRPRLRRDRPARPEISARPAA